MIMISVCLPSDALSQHLPSYLGVPYLGRGVAPIVIGSVLLEISGEITLERMKGWSQRKNNTQLWMGLVIGSRSDAVKSNIP